MGISTHILDTALGLPASDVPVTLSRHEGDRWTILTTAQTDADGRVQGLLSPHEFAAPGIYCLRFDTASYYAKVGVRGLYPFIEIAFTVAHAAEHFHIPLLLTANGYTTYRGS